MAVWFSHWPPQQNSRGHTPSCRSTTTIKGDNRSPAAAHIDAWRVVSREAVVRRLLRLQPSLARGRTRHRRYLGRGTPTSAGRCTWLPPLSRPSRPQIPAGNVPCTAHRTCLALHGHDEAWLLPSEEFQPPLFPFRAGGDCQSGSRRNR